MLTETVMGESKKVVLQRIETVHQDDSYKNATIDNLRVSCFHHAEANTSIDSRVAF